VRWVLCALLVAGCSAPEAPRWRVAGGFVRDPDGRAALLRGVNISGEHKVKPYLSFHGPAEFRRARQQWGISAIRFLIEWAAIEPQRDQFDDAYLARVAGRVQQAGEAGLLVVLDMHQDVYGEGFVGFNGAPRWTCDESRYAAFKPRDPWFASYLDDNVLACVDGFYQSPELRAHYVERGGAWRSISPIRRT
jgi:hypothetical protein